MIKNGLKLLPLTVQLALPRLKVYSAVCVTEGVYLHFLPLMYGSIVY